MTSPSPRLSIVEKIVGIHRSFGDGALPHAFGGALALAWCTAQARGTVDIDVNVFVDVTRSSDVVDALPLAVTRSDADRLTLERDGQVRLWWDRTPVDVFLNTSEFHEQVAMRARIERFGNADIPFLACSDLAVFKAFFNRTKDWADIEAMIEAGSLDIDRVIGTLVRYLGVDDERVTRLLGLV